MPPTIEIRTNWGRKRRYTLDEGSREARPTGQPIAMDSPLNGLPPTHTEQEPAASPTSPPRAIALDVGGMTTARMS